MEKKVFGKDNSLALKGIAIIMLMFHHCFRKASIFKGYSVSFFPLGQNATVEMALAFKICVSIFAFITGYGLMISLKKLNEKYEWTKKEIFNWEVTRLIKTLSGFWIIAIIAYIACQFLDGRTQVIFFKNGIVYGIIQMIINFFGLSNLFGTAEICSTWWYMSIAVMFIIVIPVFAKLFKKYNYLSILGVVVILPRILGWEYVNSSFISFLFPVLIGMICAEKNLLVKIANFKVINKNNVANKILKFILETALIIILAIIFINLPKEKFWEIRYGIIPFCLICYLYEFFIDLPVLKQVLKFLGKHAMNIFLIHTFLQAYYLKDFIYSFKNFALISIVLLLISLAISIALELIKKLIRYDKIIEKLILKLTNK